MSKYSHHAPVFNDISMTSAKSYTFVIFVLCVYIYLRLYIVVSVGVVSRRVNVLYSSVDLCIDFMSTVFCHVDRKQKRDDSPRGAHPLIKRHWSSFWIMLNWNIKKHLPHDFRNKPWNTDVWLLRWEAIKYQSIYMLMINWWDWKGGTEFQLWPIESCPEELTNGGAQSRWWTFHILAFV